MTAPLARRLEVAANIALIVTCLVACAVLLRSRSASAVSGSPVVAPGSLIDQVDASVYKQAQSTLLMFVRARCQYCTGSMPFYRSLRNTAVTNGVRLVVVSSDPADVATDYLKNHRVDVDAIVNSPNTIPTPTLALVDSSGRVRRSWMGQLDSRGEQEVFAELGKYTRR